MFRAPLTRAGNTSPVFGTRRQEDVKPARVLLAPASHVSKLQIFLTPREREVVRGVLAARTNREIAQELGLTEQAVKNVLSTVYIKYRVRNRLELALFLVQHDLLPR